MVTKLHEFILVSIKQKPIPKHFGYQTPHCSTAIPITDPYVRITHINRKTNTTSTISNVILNYDATPSHCPRLSYSSQLCIELNMSGWAISTQGGGTGPFKPEGVSAGHLNPKGACRPHTA
ncbi:hypothetical protein XENTR_v10010940 [Xenopus tropicalis]|nr:hypothetical protein XENTR_v10010940 [Xenopus tropicalis]